MTDEELIDALERLSLEIANSQIADQIVEPIAELAAKRIRELTGKEGPVN